MTLQELHCERCGATLPALDAAGDAVCQYCGQRYRQIQVPVPSMPGKSPQVALLVAMGGVGILAVTGVVVFVRTAARSPDEVAPGPETVEPKAEKKVESSELGRGLPPPAPSTEEYDTVSYPADLMFDDVGGAPVAVAIGGKDAWIARFRSTGADELFVVAGPAEGGPPLWKLGPLGTYSDGYTSTRFVTLGDRVVVSDWRSVLHVLDLSTGQELQSLTLTDRVKRLCASPALERVYFEQVDERRYLLDLATGALTVGGRPEDCPLDKGEDRRASWGREKDKEVQVPGMYVGKRYVSGDLGVARGYKSPGTPVPLLVGFDPSTLAVRWSGPAAQADPARVQGQELVGALAGDRFVVACIVGTDEWYLSALDARSGARLWNVRMPDIFAVDRVDSVVAGKEHVYVGHMSSLESYRLSDGQLVRVAGQEVYEGEKKGD